MTLQSQPLSELEGHYDYYRTKHDPSRLLAASLVDILIRKDSSYQSFLLPKLLIRDYARYNSNTFRALASSASMSSTNKYLWKVFDPILTYSEFSQNSYQTLEHEYQIGIQGTEGVFLNGLNFDLLTKADFNFSDVLYYPIPDFREVEYAFSSSTVPYVFVDASKFNFNYDTLRLFVGESIESLDEVDISNFERYRDGGTTQFSFTYKGVTHRAYFPASIAENAKNVPTIDGLAADKLSTLEVNEIIDKLGILQYPKTNR